MSKFRVLKPEEIEVKVKQVTEKGAVALIYKTSRVDMDILDETVGAENWQSEYQEIKGNLYCGIGIKDETTQDWVWKWDCGIESRSDGDGNEKKGEASDAFKRAGVQWGIGRELYTAPFIFLPLETVSNGKGYKLKNPFSRFDVKEIEYTESRKISKITIVDERGREVFQYPKEATKAKQTAKTEEWKLTKSELVQVYGVKKAEATIAALEKKLKVPYAEWDKGTTQKVRETLERMKKRNNEEMEKYRSELEKTDDDDLPF
jgi:hypothetical protein